VALPCDVLMSIICPSGRGCGVEYALDTATRVGTRRWLRTYGYIHGDSVDINLTKALLGYVFG